MSRPAPHPTLSGWPTRAAGLALLAMAAACGVESVLVVGTRSGDGGTEPDAGTDAAGADADVPACPAAADTALGVTSGDDHSCVWLESGNAWCWGQNDEGQVGDGTTQVRLLPVHLAGLVDVEEITAGDDHSCAVASSGTLWCWGDNAYDQLGLGSGAGSREEEPQQVGTLSDWISVSTFSDSSCGLRGGTIWCWGDNSRGQLGAGDTSGRDEPTQVGSETSWKTVVNGDLHTCGLRTTGDLYCWGRNSTGQLGLDDTADRDEPVLVGAGWEQVSPAVDHSCGIKLDGSLWCWGGNGSGQLGLGDTDSRHLPARVGDATDWAWVASGEDHTCAVRQDRTLWCWGAAGYLGLTDGQRHDEPVVVPTLAAVEALDANTDHTCAILTDGTVWCWGENDDGKLGLGDTLHRDSPEQVCVPPEEVPTHRGG